jgi:SAM-dependent methyltransferase
MSQEVHRSFSRAATRYSRHARVQQAVADWLAEWLPRDRRGRALEVGAGPGTFTRRLLPWDGRIVASDLSAAMCSAGRSELPSVSWEVRDAADPGSGPWDWIFSSSVLQWVSEPVGVFGAWRHALAPGGRVLAGIPISGSLAELHGLDGESPLRWREADAWLEALRQSGLRVLRSDTTELVFHYPTARDFLRDLHGVGAAPRRRYTAGALRDLMRRYESLHRFPEGVRASWRFLRVEAVRDA